MAVGSDVKRCAVGDTVIHEKFGGVEFSLDGQWHAKFKETEILAIEAR